MVKKVFSSLEFEIGKDRDEQMPFEKFRLLSSKKQLVKLSTLLLVFDH